jgi:hypothetical protein
MIKMQPSEAHGGDKNAAIRGKMNFLTENLISDTVR